VKFGGRFAGRRQSLNPDPEVIRELANLLTETGLTEIEYAVGDHRIRVARETAATVNGNVYAAPTPVAPVAAPVAPPPAAEPAAPAQADALHPGAVTSPIVGVAYLSPQPGAAPFVRVGDAVNEGETLLIIEAMKVMNQIRAPRAGRIARVLVEDGDPVEYGAPLVLIE
jgi:acetyl-CoA carboxylase biotin carboxyl carrier protein